MRIKIKDLDEPITGKSVKIEMFYDPHLRLWTLYPVDENGYQTGNAEYAYGKKDALFTKQCMEDEYLNQEESL